MVQNLKSVVMHVTAQIAGLSTQIPYFLTTTQPDLYLKGNTVLLIAVSAILRLNFPRQKQTVCPVILIFISNLLVKIAPGVMIPIPGWSAIQLKSTDRFLFHCQAHMLQPIVLNVIRQKQSCGLNRWMMIVSVVTRRTIRPPPIRITRMPAIQPSAQSVIKQMHLSGQEQVLIMTFFPLHKAMK